MTVYLVGSGPGGIGLLTIKAREIINSAEVILYDQLPGDEIIESLPSTAEKIDVGKFGGHHTMKQQEIESLMIEKARKYSRVVRLKGGDPFVFGRGGEEMEALGKAGIDVEVIPGITSGIAVPESIGIPVTHRNYASSVTFVTGHEKNGGNMPDWNWLAKCPGTLVIYMGAKNIGMIAEKLLAGGMNHSTKVAIIENGFRKNQKTTITKLEDLPNSEGFNPPAIIILGEVVRLYHDEEVTIRLEKKEEQRDVENLVRESFWNVYRPGCLEHYVLNQLRNDQGFVPELDFIMEKDGKLIGQTIFMKAVIKADDGRDIDICTMGPICISPELKRKGYGKKLLDYSLEKAREYGFKAICFEGNIDFYGKSGFKYASEYGIRYHGLPEGEDASFFLCKELEPGYLDNVTGEYTTPSSYFVDEKAAEEFDKQFPKKEKLKLPGQIF